VPPVLIVPGLGGSGPAHWQTLWEQANPAFTRVGQRDWNKPDRNEWIAALDRVIAAQPVPPILVAHSLACALVAHWAAGVTRPLHGALLVAPADVESEQHTPPEVRGFAPMPLAPIPAPCIVAASANDPFVDPARARFFASAWGARLVEVGACGHINAASGLGEWPDGKRLLDSLRDA
jgi:predicted alpha/beta hydrolase family esterase